jgi:monoterpene epsilon-lactone hydrolase
MGKPRNLPPRVVRAGLVTQRLGLGGPMSLSRSRRYLDRLARGLPFPGGVSRDWTMLGGRRTLRLTPVDAHPDAAVLYLHGGAYTVGSAVSYSSLGGFLAAASSATVYLPDYRLAPEDPFPAALDDARAAYLELRDRRAHVVVGGDSAGGGLSVAAARAVIDAGAPAPIALVLASPWVNLAQRSERPRDHVVSDKWGQTSAAMYAGSIGVLDSRVSPGLGNLVGLPPTVIHVGTSEILLPQVREFAVALEAAGVDVTLREYGWMWHVAHLQAGLTKPAADAIADFGDFIRARL